MHRTTGAGNVGGAFVDEVPGVTAGTAIEEDWLNTLQEELAGIVESTGEALDGGDDGQVLAAIVAIGRGFAEDLVSTDYVILDGDGFTEFEVSTGAVDRTITLPDRATNLRRRITVRKSDSGVGKVIVAAAGADEINGTPTWEITEQYGYVVLQENGTEWAVRAQEGSVYRAEDASNQSQAVPADDTWYNLGAFALSGIPDGLYALAFSVKAYANDADNGSVSIECTLSTANNSESDSELTAMLDVTTPGASLSIRSSLAKGKRVTLSGGPTTLYLNTRTTRAGVNSINNINSEIPAVIEARRIA